MNLAMVGKEVEKSSFNLDMNTEQH